MITNILILLLANTFIPLLPIPPQIFIIAPITSLYFTQPSAYSYMNMSRLHSQDDFKKSFREALKLFHPDRGGSQEAFSRVKNLKKIMEQNPKYYDTLNITQVDIQFNEKLNDVVSNKQGAYFVFTAIFYFITILYSIAFTIDDNLKPSRKFIIPLIIIFLAYQFLIHTYPQYPTIIDFINPQIPIFIQKDILKYLLIILIAIIRTMYIRKKTPQKQLLKQLYEQNLQLNKYKEILIQIRDIYSQKVKQKQIYSKSPMAKIKKWLSYGITIIIIISVVSGLFGQQQTARQF